MSFSISQIQNVLRTYQSLLKRNATTSPDPSESSEDSFDDQPVHDTVTISEEGRKRLNQNQSEPHGHSTRK